MLLAAASVMMFVAGLSYRRVLTALVILPWPLVASCCSSRYRRQRLLAFLNPYDDPLGKGFQTIQSLIAVGTGGVWGKGFMAGVQKMFYLPEAHTDYIFAVIAEEQRADRRGRRAAVLRGHHLARARAWRAGRPTPSARCSPWASRR